MKALLLICSLIFLTGCPAARSMAIGAMQSSSRGGMSAYEARRIELEEQRLVIERQRQMRERLREIDAAQYGPRFY